MSRTYKKIWSLTGAVLMGLILVTTLMFFVRDSAHAARDDLSTSMWESSNLPAALCDTVTEVPQSECEALVALYNNTEGGNWNDNTDWLLTNTPCSWYGVSCNAGHITQLDGWQNNLSGTIPTSLGDLTNLTYLDLSVNQLSGTIPTQLGNLVNLRHLYLDQNQLSGQIPISFGSLTNLQSLSLGGNNFDGTIPNELVALTKLTHLGLNNNQFTGSIPTWIGNITTLKDLDLGRNQFTGTLPATLGNLTNLTYLSTGFNNFTPAPLPPEFNNMTSMRELFINGSNLTGPLPDLSNLTNMKILWAGGNQMDGPIPIWIGDITTLEELDLSDQKFSGTIPAEIGNLINLNTIWINGNKDLGGEIPTTITNLVNLIPEDDYTRFGYNKLYSDDPTVIAFMNEKDSDWADTQTIPPEDPHIPETTTSNNFRPEAITGAGLQLSWTPIPFSDGTGYYEISYALSATGTFTVHGTTIDKTVGSYWVDDLQGYTTYYFRVRTFSSDVGANHFDMWSEYSDIVSGTTGASIFEIYLPLVIK